MHKIITIIVGCFLFLDEQTPAYSSEQFSWIEPEIDIGMEFFRWQEFAADNSKILEENGPRVFVIIKSTNTDNKGSRILHDISIKAYTGQVAYDGRTQPTNGNVPVETDTNYSGWNADLKLAYRMEKSFIEDDIDIIVGLGIDSWEREIESGIDVNGSGVNGITENYSIAYVRLGVGILHAFENASGYFEGGLKRPFDTNEDVVDISLSPEGALSLYASYKIMLSKYAVNQHPFVTFYYDSFRFGRSASEVSTVLSGNAHQPKSHLDIVGVTLGRTF